MQTKTLGAVASFSVSVAAGAAVVIWPERIMAWAVFLGSLGVLFVCVAWWFLAAFRVRSPFIRRNRSARLPDQNAFQNKVVRLVDLVRPGAHLLSGCQFSKCVIEGPAFIKLIAGCRLEMIGSADEPGQNITVAVDGTPIRGAILLSHVVFAECFFDGVAVIGTAVDAAQALRAFHQETREAWARRVGFPVNPSRKDCPPCAT